MGMPAVVIGDHRHGDVAKLGLPRQFSLLQIRHADYVHAEPTVHIRFGLRGKLRAFHAEIGPATPAGYTHLLTSCFDYLRQRAADRIAKPNLPTHSPPENP